ncbi:hypothetical protein E4656_03080 [Natronospirillum operosum]|uniref:HEPN domain-containing protein n=1 Tax=Natronospirillum operosum TaxID=2759953 RepID=A0A4Z0WB76_9GAMM|nr:hypothetical protein [Natronospirillum operosum]TGG95422.1 hypothetical protein E4656_03080 [Natronospirillum operosum]
MAYDPIRINNVSSSFHVASKRCMEQRRLPSGKLEMPLVPAVVCQAFAVELGLKAILESEGNSCRGHKLKELYDSLSIEAKKSISDVAGCSEEFMELNMEKISNIFVEWRYIYESDEAGLDLEFFNNLANAVHHVANKRVE